MFRVNTTNPVRLPATRGLGLALVCVQAAALVACGDPAPDAAEQAATTTTARPAAPNADLVKAVAVGSADAPVDVSFELLGKPVPGTPLQLRLVLTTTGDVDELQTLLEAPQGLTLTDDSVYFQVGKSAAGERHEHKFNLLPNAQGIHLLTVTATADIGDGSFASQFAIPIIAQP